MLKYTGYDCPVCGKTFSDGDDVVVCPDCGAPYHRTCYQKQGRCGFDSLHEQALQWQPPHPPAAPAHEAAPQTGTVPCPRCGSDNPADALTCQICGWRLDIPSGYWEQPLSGPDSEAGPRQEDGYRAEGAPGTGAAGHAGFGTSRSYADFFSRRVDFNAQLAEGVTVKDAADFAGPNCLNFILKFQNISRLKNAFSFNICAFFFSFAYCFYRRMYKLGTILLAIMLAAFLPYLYCTMRYMAQVIDIYGIEQLLSLAIPQIEGAAMNAFVFSSSALRIVHFAVMVFSGFAFDRLYFRHAVHAVRQVKQNGRCSSGSSELSGCIARAGGVSIVPVILLLVGYFALTFLAASLMLTY